MAVSKKAVAGVLVAALAASPLALTVHEARVVEVTDSDTIKVSVMIWPLMNVETGVRLARVNTPEKFQPKCPAEKALALVATDYVKSLVKPGEKIRIIGPSGDKYFGRVDGEVFLKDGRNLSDLLLAHKDPVLAESYDGGTKIKDWCA